ncbi:PQQ-dependent sugar dehydrogenase [Rhizobium sp. Leaf391]|uniref:PQQ-dependent sugar dehydrogenase n=1 Tax=Rhizobium sp. Leaf391 TaxID=1736360 RepID=UPI000AFBDD92|nr:PQQ-dependent sugar dehydrogenase [Rhizobium sp. Leaf391]
MTSTCSKEFTGADQPVANASGCRTAASLLAAALLAAVTVCAPVTAVAEQLVPKGVPVDIATGFNIPWSVVVVGEEVLVSQRNTADIFAFKPGEKPRSIGKVPDVSAHLDGGLLGLAQRTEGDRIWIYAYHSTASDNRIVRMSYADGTLGDSEVVLAGIPGGRGHNGGRIAFGPDGLLYATTGESQNPNLSQDPHSLGGKILRMTPEGEAPDDNPIAGSLVYSLGHRNPQGLTWDEKGQLWTTDFGDDAWDELNRIDPGKNYGWPIVEGRGGNPAYVDPVVQWRTKEMGPSGLAYIDGTFIIAGLTGKRLWTVSFDTADEPVVASHFIGEYGRIRHALKGPDDKLWFVTNKTDGRGDNPTASDDRILAVPLGPAVP